MSVVLCNMLVTYKRTRWNHTAHGMNPDDLRARFANLQIWQANGQRAPHKPLLVLWSIGRCLKGEDRLVPYHIVDTALQQLLRQFGPRRKRAHTEDPFWRLQNGDLWEIPNAHSITVGSSGGAHKSSLIQHRAQGGFPKDIFMAFKENPKLAIEIAYMLVEAHFPSTRHDEIMHEVGIDSEFSIFHRRVRDPSFGRTVLEAYSYQCAVCAFAVRLDNEPLALEGAHIKWHRARGPDSVKNGLSLCALHHRLFDRGAFTLLSDRRVVVAKSLSGKGMQHSLGQFDSKTIILPASEDHFPDPKFLSWHQKEVFILKDAVS